jgi:hypothetical protein
VYALLFGAAFGFALDDVLKAVGLHWLVWPIMGLLLLFTLAGAVVMRRRGRRS